MFESSSISCLEGAIRILPCTDVMSVTSASLIISCAAKVSNTLKGVVLASITMVLVSTLKLLM